MVARRIFIQVHLLFVEGDVWNPEWHKAFSRDHIEAQAEAPDRILDYNNLVYSCCNGNSCRQNLNLPCDPCEEPLGHDLKVDEIGIVVGLTSTGLDYIELCQLNRPTLIDFRRRVIRILKLLNQSIDSELTEVALEYFQLPIDLPDLSKLHQKENKRPAGITQSYFAMAEERDS